MDFDDSEHYDDDDDDEHYLASENQIGHFPSNFSLFSRLPPQEVWLRHGVVERQTVANDITWQQRLMVLTSKDILFTRPDTDIVVDRLPIKEIKFVGKVDQGKLPELAEKKKAKSKGTSVKFDQSFDQNFDRQAVAESQDGPKATFAFEIKALAWDRERSYFARVLTSELREAWVKDIRSAIECTRSAVSNEGHLLVQYQRRLRHTFNSTPTRSLIAFAILCDFITDIVMSEFLFPEDSGSYRFFYAVGRVLDFFFGFELLLAAAANWRTWSPPRATRGARRRRPGGARKEPPAKRIISL